MSTDPYICIHMAAVCIVPMGEVLSHFINPRRLCEGYCSRSVCVSVSLSVNSLTATYFVCESQARCYENLYAVSNACIVWISLETLCSPVQATFAQDRYLPSWIHPSMHLGSF